MGPSIAKLGERGTLVEGDMISLAALDLVLWIVRAFDLELASMHAGDCAADAPHLGIPAHAIMDLEVLRHGCWIRCRRRTAKGAVLALNSDLLERHEHSNRCASYRFLKNRAIFLTTRAFDSGCPRLESAAGSSCAFHWNDDTNIFFTIGHSTRTIVEFVDLLRESGIGLVIDVRSMPRSRANPQFNQQSLPEALAPWQIGYEHIAELGGLRGKSRGVEPSPNTYWRVRSFRNYADYALTAPFAAGLARLRERGSQQRCVIMCAEAVWWRCHRRIIADYLLAAGEQVMHILGKSHVDEASLTPGADVRNDGTVVYPAAQGPQPE